ncbi:HAD-IB family hydrolase [Salinisphaera sp. SPP-AMP-43]|uniref:HAD family hydrolase n=1 Tax=Salinisphaera sp. SPP-AMP-43 TaxID=3121288 RepID=UPI003C6E5C21
MALFDLDNTLIAGDCDTEWLAFMVTHGLIDQPTHDRLSDWFETEYAAGTIDLQTFSQTVLAPLSDVEAHEITAWRDRFLEERIAPLVLPDAEALIDDHRRAGDRTVLVTATSTFIANPVAERLGVDSVLATPVAFGPDRPSGPLATTACFRRGKIDHVEAYCQELGASPASLSTWAERATFYSDSHNDLALLRWVGRPVAVDPDPHLAAEAQKHGWPIMSLRSRSARSQSVP